MSLDAAADELYGLGPDEFVPRRTALVKEAKAGGDKTLAAEIGVLRKPSTAAWALNVAVRADPAVFDEVFAIGEQLRAAQAELDAAELRRLLKERHAVVAAATGAVRTAAERAGRALSDSVAAEVDEALRATLADPGFAAAIQHGRLVGAEPQGTPPPLDLTTAVDRPPSRKDRRWGWWRAVGRSSSRKRTPEGGGTSESGEPAGAVAQRPMGRKTTTSRRKGTLGDDSDETKAAARASVAARAARERALVKAKEGMRAAQARVAEVARRRKSLDLERAELDQRLRAIEVDERRSTRALEQAQAALDAARAQ